MLYAEWYADNRDAEYDSQSDVCKGNFNTSEQDPDDVHKDGQTSGIARSRCYFSTEWPNCQACHFKQLYSERYADNAQAEKQTDHSIVHAYKETSKNNPEYIAYEFHFSLIIQESTLCRPYHP